MMHPGLGGKREARAELLVIIRRIPHLPRVNRRSAATCKSPHVNPRPQAIPHQPPPKSTMISANGGCRTISRQDLAAISAFLPCRPVGQGFEVSSLHDDYPHNLRGGGPHHDTSIVTQSSINDWLE